MAEREETADAVGVVGDGPVGDSTVVVGGTSVEHGSWVECPNTFDRRLANIPIMDVTPLLQPVANCFSTFARLPQSTRSRMLRLILIILDIPVSHTRMRRRYAKKSMGIGGLICARVIRPTPEQMK